MIRMKSSSWLIVYGDNFYCDYLKALNIAKMLQQVHSPQEQEEEVKQLIGLLQRGTLLPTFVHYEWFGNIKINHDELFIRIIEKLLPIVEANNEPRKVIVLSDVLLPLLLVLEVNEPVVAFLLYSRL